MTHCEYLIVGQGLAGSVLAHKLLQLKKDILVIDNTSTISSTSVAAGLYNPLVFKRITLSWMIEQLIPSFTKFYQSIEQQTDTRFFFDKNILKLTNQEEHELWYKKAHKERIARFIKKLHTNINLQGVNPFHGAAQVQEAGHVDLKTFLSITRNMLASNQQLVNEHFRYEELTHTGTSYQYANIMADKIIFCEGAYAINNPYFSFIDYYLTKGDVLEVELPGLVDKYILNKNAFLLPKGNDQFLCGSTYKWSGLDFQTYEADKAHLLDKIKVITEIPARVLEHKTAIRPTVRDRRPAIGAHPKFKNMFYFNGLGTKGVMLAPHFSDELINAMEHNSALNEEVNLQRFLK